MKKNLHVGVTIGGHEVKTTDLEVSEGHKQTTARFSLSTPDVTGLQLNDVVSIDIGYQGDHGVIFKGFVDAIQSARMPGLYTITGRDILKKAIEHFMVSESLDAPWSREDVEAEMLVHDLLLEAQITEYDCDTSNFTFGVDGPAEFNLMASWDAVRTICHIIAYNCYAEDGIVYFKRVFPVPGATATKDFTVGSGGNIILIDYGYNTDNLRNKVVCFGKKGIRAEASSPDTPQGSGIYYLPAGFFKTAIVSNELIDSQKMADDSVVYNLDLYNRLTEYLRVEAEGDHTVRCRDTISVSEPFTGMSNSKWFVYSISHRVDSDSYTMSLNLSR